MSDPTGVSPADPQRDPAPEAPNSAPGIRHPDRIPRGSRLATRASFAYAVVRVVPRVERGEFLNAGVILYCPSRRFLDARVELDVARLAALAPGLDSEPVRRRLELIPRICAGGSDAGPIGQLPQAERFHWLVAPVSTVVQVSPVHTGLSDHPRAALDRLMAELVHLPPPP